MIQERSKNQNSNQTLTRSKDIYLTGGNGQLGTAVRRLLKIRGLKANVLSRSKIKVQENETYIPFKLGEHLKIDCAGASVVLIHLAHDYFDNTPGESNINSLGLRRLFKSFNNYSSFKTIYISTPMDVESVASTYQEQKLIGERICNNENTLILKPSFVFSKNSGVNRLFHLFSLLKFPLLLPDVSARIAPLYDNNLAKLIISDPALHNKVGNYLVVGKDNMTFKEYLHHYHGLKTITMPNGLLKFLVFFLNKLSCSYCFYLNERIVGLMELRDIGDLQKSNPYLIVEN